MRLLAECFETAGGVPAVVLADRMGCLKGGVVANVGVPAPASVAFAAHYSFRPDFCEAADPESKGVVELLVGYAKRDLLIPASGSSNLEAANEAARAWCAEVNTAVHSVALAGRHVGDVVAVDEDAPGIGTKAAGHATQRGRLAAAARPSSVTSSLSWTSRLRWSQATTSSNVLTRSTSWMSFCGKRRPVSLFTAATRVDAAASARGSDHCA